MIDLAAIKKRCEDVDRLLQEQPWLWLERQATPALKDRVELVAEVERLRMILEQDGAAHLPCQHCGKDVATPTLESVELCFDCWERLRELIPDAGMMHRLIQKAEWVAQEMWDEQSQRDIADGYALVKKLHGEANIGRE